MGKSKIIIIGILLLFATGAWAQVSRYVVSFTDKEGTPFSVEQPEDFLSERSIARRQKQDVAVTENDLPVNPAYVNQLAGTGAEVYYTSRWMNLALIQADASVLPAVSGLPFVKQVTLVAPGTRLTQPASSGGRFKSRGNGRILATTEVQNGMLSVQHMHRQNFLGQGILIAVFDGGFAGVDTAPFFEHLVEYDKIQQTFDFVTNAGYVFNYDDHGTRVLSCMASKMVVVDSGDTVLSYGSAPEADYALFITEDIRSEYRIEEYNWLFAAEKADSLGADVIHSSVGYNLFNSSSMNYSFSDMDGQTAVSTQAANYAFEKGIFVVASVGNEGNNSWKKVTAPADSPNVLAVGAIDAGGSLASFSSAGPTADGRTKPDVVALGVFTTVGTDNGSVVTANGTSYSAPIVAGLVAGLIQANPEKTNTEIFQDILKSGDKANDPDTLFGYGVPDFVKAMDGKILSVDDVINDKIKVYPNPFSENKLNIRINNALAANGLKVEMFDANGKLIARKTYNSFEMDDVLEFEFQGVTPGIYFLKLSARTFEKQVKLLRY